MTLKINGFINGRLAYIIDKCIQNIVHRFIRMKMRWKDGDIEEKIRSNLCVTRIPEEETRND